MLVEETTIISKNDHLSDAENYQLLRKLGLEYIEHLGSDLWTDYNAHDPGITILEALCYAITELGYRTSLPINDLLTESDGTISAKQPFYTARNILTTNPLTINDYRKLLVDIEGVHNGWLYATDRSIIDNVEQPINEVPLFADCKADKITTKKTSHPLFLSGLYTVLLDLDIDDQFGDLNKGDIEIFNAASSSFAAGEISLTIELPAVGVYSKTFIDTVADKDHIASVNVFEENGMWMCKVTADTTEANTFGITINLKPRGKEIQVVDLEEMFTPGFVSQIFFLYKAKMEKVRSILLIVKRTLHENRNLCEDFISTTIVKDEEIAICCDVDVRPGADMEKVQAEAFYMIENYLNPSVSFYLLKELIDKGTRVEDIFDGPKLQHGFIDTTELEATQLRSVIYTSDIINLLMDIPGVLSVRNVMLTKYDENGKAIKNETGLRWCMHVGDQHKPVLSINRSKMIFYKNNFPFLANYTEIKDTLTLLRAGRERAKLTGQQDDIAIPVGIHLNLEEYYSIQNDLPQTYKVGKAGMPQSESPARKAQAKQLKAYLLFYDQLLAGFFSQLSNAKWLLSVDDIKQTYYQQFLNTIPGIEPIYNENSPGNATLKDVFINQDSTLGSINKEWEALVETSEQFEERRNRFLDHLLARFAESFNDYVLMMYHINFKDKVSESITTEKLIKNKVDFLKEYSSISYKRGAAFNYYPLTSNFEIDLNKLWDTDNVSGLEKRTSKLSGIESYLRRYLSCIKNIEVKTVQEKVVEEDSTELVKTYYQFVIENQRGDKLEQKDKFEKKEDIDKVIKELLELLPDKANYLYDAGSHKIEIISSDSSVLASSVTSYSKKPDAEKAIKQFANEFTQPCPDAAGMHLIEHILLRPRKANSQLMQVCLSADCDFCGEEDPYTFRASLFLPYWPEQFENINFRTYFEELVRTEAPAHLMLKICWLNNEEMRELEVIYKKWICALAETNHEPTDTSKAEEFNDLNDQLVTLLSTLHSIYPEATLHDCDESVNTNPVMLGKTILGTLKPKSNE